MEAILRSLLLRQEHMVMQWDAEFEQQKQLFHLSTSTLVDMLPIRPRKKRLRVGGRGPIPSHDKENLVGFQGFLPNSACAESPKTKAPHSRGLTKRDLNMRFCDNDVKDVGRIYFKPTEAEPSRLQSSSLNGLDAENVQRNGRVACPVSRSNQVSLAMAVKIEVDEGDACQMHISPPTDEMPSLPGKNRKRILGQVESGVLGTYDEENKELPRNPDKAKQCPAEVETCRDSKITRSSKPEIMIHVEVEPEEQTCRDAQAVEATKPQIASQGPARRGPAKGTSAAGKELARRERAKKAPTASGAVVPEIAQRITRSRARKVEGVVELKSETCEQLLASHAASKEAVQEMKEVAAHASPNVEDSSTRGGNSEPRQGPTAADCDAKGEGRSANQIVESKMNLLCQPEVRAPPQEGVAQDEPIIKRETLSKERNSVARSRKKHPANNLVTCDVEGPGHVTVSSHADSQVKTASSYSGTEEQSVRIGSRVAESIQNASADLSKDGQHEYRPEPRLERIEEDEGHRKAIFSSAEHPIVICEGTEVRDGSAPLAPSEAPPAEEETARSAHCSAAPEGDTLVGEVWVDRAKEVSRMEVKVTADGRLASNSRALRPSAARLSRGEADLLPLGRGSILTSDAASIKVVTRTFPTYTRDGNTALLSEMIQGSIIPSEKLGAPVSSPESVVVARPRKSSLRSASAAFTPELPDPGRICSGSEVPVLLNAGVTRKSIVEDRSVDRRDGSLEHTVEGLITLPSEGQGTEGDSVFVECSIEANIEFAERSWHTKGESGQDAVLDTSSGGSCVKEPENATQTRDGTSMMDTSTRERAKSDAVSPARFSKARAIGEAMRCYLEQDFHPDVTLTLNRWQFRKRLSPRSKARARRWRSDVSTNGVDHVRRQSSEAPVASPSRVVSSRDRSVEGTAYETFLETQSPNPEAALGGVEPAFGSGAEKAVDQEHTTSWQVGCLEHAPQPKGMARLSIASLCNDVLSQGLHDGETGDNSVEYEVMETADENVSLSPLLRSIFKLSKACGNDLVGVGGILEEEGEQHVHSLIESAKKIMEQVSSKRAQAAGASPRTPASNHLALNSSRFHDHTNLYPDRFRLFMTPRSSRAAPPMLPPSASSFPVSPTPAVASLLPDDMESTSPQMKHLTQETIEEAVFKSPDHDSILSKSAVGADGVVSRARSRTLRSGEIPKISETGNVHFSGEGYSAPDFSDADGPGSGRLTRTDAIHVHLASDVHPTTIVRGTSAIASASPLRRSVDNGVLESCDGSILLSGDQIDAVDAFEFVTHQSQVPLRSETMAETDKLSGLRSRCSALARHSLVGTSSTAKDLPNLLGAIAPFDPSEDVAAHTQGAATASAVSMLQVEPQRFSNVVDAAPGSVPSSSYLPHSNLVSSIRSFIPLVQQQPLVAPYFNGKRDVKVKALEAAEAARRLAEQKELEKQDRKKAAEAAKREKQERAAQEKLAKREKAAQEARAKENLEASKWKAAASGTTKSTMADSSNRQGTSSQNVLLKVKKIYELKLKMDQDKQERLQEEQRRKEEEWKKKAENAARKRKHEAAEKKEREQKRRRQEEVAKAHREMEERLRLELEKKTQKTQEEMEKKRMTIEEELKRQKRLGKEREVENCRKKEKELAWLDQKEGTRNLKEEATKQMKLLEAEGRQHSVKMPRPYDDPAMTSPGPSLHVAMGIGEGVGGIHLSGVNNLIDSQRVSSQSLAGHPLGAPQQSGEGAGAALSPCRNSQAALRVARTTVQSALDVSNIMGGSGKPLFCAPPEALGTSVVASVAGTSGGASSARPLRERASAPQGQSGSKSGVTAAAGGSKPCQPGQVGFSGPPGGLIGDKTVQSYEVSPFRDSEDEESDEEEKRSQKPIPEWARTVNIWPQLVRQLQQDPDDIFVGTNSCSLDEVFEVKGSKKRPIFRRRGSSGDWVKDCLTWQEQIQYKETMGYLH